MIASAFLTDGVIPAKAGISVCQGRDGAESPGPGRRPALHTEREPLVPPTEIPAFAGMTS